MPAWIMDVSIGGTFRIKVEAPDEDKAMELAQLYAIEDWENAGPMKLGDAHIDSFRAAVTNDEGFDASIVDTGESTWERAADDPIYEEVDGPTVSAGG